jgi:hypothetical protein
MVFRHKIQQNTARTAHSPSKPAPKYTASTHATTSSATPTHFSTTDSTPSVVLASSSSCFVPCRIASYNAALLALLSLGMSPGVLCKHRENLYFAGGLCQAKPRTKQRNDLVVYLTLAS